MLSLFDLKPSPGQEAQPGMQTGMAAPPLVDLCVVETAALITQAKQKFEVSYGVYIADCSRHEEALKLPFELLNKVLLHLPPLALHYFQQYVLMRLKEADPENSRKRKYPDSSAVVMLDFSVAWENLVRSHHSEMRNYRSLCKAKECMDWEQLYWEAHIQTCLDYVTAQVSVPNFEGQMGPLALPEEVVHRIGDACDQESKIQVSSLRSTLLRFGRFVKSLRIQGILCSEELRDLLRTATLKRISFYNVRTSSKFSNAFQILAPNAKSLKRLEFFHCKFLEKDFDTLCDILCDLSHFSIVSSYIQLSGPTSRLGQFLKNTRSLRSMQLLSNRIPIRSMSAMVVDLLSQTSASLSNLQLNDNVLEFNSQEVNQFLMDCSRRQQPFLPGLKVLDLRYCFLDSACTQKLVHYLKCLPLLEHLNLSYNPVGDEGIRALVYCLQTSTFSLQKLDVTDCELSCSGVSFLLDALLSSTLTLKSLSISDNNLGGDGSKILARFLERSTVEVLDIAEIGLGSLGCSSELALSLVSNRNLVHLDISKNRIAAGGAELLHAVISKGQGVLTSIDASYNLLSLDSMKLLATALLRNSGKIRRLDLRGNPGCQPDAFCWFEPFLEGPEPIVLLSSSPLAPLHDDDP